MIFIGAASIKGGETYTYKLQVNDSNGILKGYSITDVMGPNETKTAVIGSIDTARKQINYKETKIIYTKSKAPKSDFCYIYAHLKISDVKGATALKGHFTGYKEDGKTQVATGKLALVSAQDVLDKLLEIAAKDSLDSVKKHPPEKEIKYTNEEAIPESKVKKLMPGDTIKLTCPSQAIMLDLWDAKTIDGDIITLYQDDKTLLENYTLSGTHKQVKVYIDKEQKSILTLVAISEGSEPLNTARIKVSSGDNIYYVDATTTIGKNVIIVLTGK